jgi:hypothetical protein
MVTNPFTRINRSYIYVYVDVIDYELFLLATRTANLSRQTRMVVRTHLTWRAIQDTRTSSMYSSLS